MFVEGVISNGEGLVDFKKGAFVFLKPMEVMSVKYISKVSACLMFFNLLESVVGLMCCLFNEIEHYSLDCVIEPKKGVTW